MTRAWLVKRAAAHQWRNLGNLVRGARVATTPLSGMTLDMDDVDLARALLRDPPRRRDALAVDRFEAEFAEWNGSLRAFAFMSGRAALSACIEALDFARGDEVIVPGYTCVVVPNAIRFAGLTPVYCDIELDTYGVDVEAFEAAITDRTRAVVIHHLFGLVCRDYDRLLNVAARHRVAVIEDCAHATGAVHRGIRVGNRGLVAFYSSEQSKIFNTVQGGVAVTNDQEMAARLASVRGRAPTPADDTIEKLCRNVILQFYRAKAPQRWWRGDLAALVHGDAELVSTSDIELRREMPRGYGARMAGAVAELASNQLRKIDRYNDQRRVTARRWDEWCVSNGHRPPLVAPESVPVFLRYPVMVQPENKTNTAWAAEELGIELGVWFLGSEHPLSGVVGGCSRAAAAVAGCVNFPCLVH